MVVVSMESLHAATSTRLEESHHSTMPIGVATSNASLDEASAAYPLAHQYHYIQYPVFYQNNNFAQRHQSAAQQCQCPCSCGGGQNNALQQQRIPMQIHAKQQQPQQPDGQMAVAVIVHHQHQSTGADSQRPLKTQSAQSLLNHSYQALQIRPEIDAAEEKRLNICSGAVDAATTCDCDLECTCEVAASANANAAANNNVTTNAIITKQRHCNAMLADAMLGVDEITVSESDNNSTMIKKKKTRNGSNNKPCCSRDGNALNADHNDDDDDEATELPQKNCNEIYHDNELEDANYYLKSNNSTIAGDDQRPPLPPRPPPRLRNATASTMAGHRHTIGIKKYVVWCLICGGFSCLLGFLFLGVYFLLHSYTITVGNFETVPTFVPATLLILTGVCIMSLARRRNRYSYLIKLSGACGLISALTCALVTVTTTVLHMSRLQALRECEYAQKTRTCTCYSDMIESQVDRMDKEGVRLVFDSLSDCGVVHGSLYSCLRAIFGLSVAGVLIAVFSCMLVYQLLSHERKKMYWEQLELRCRSLYASQATRPNLAAITAAGRMVNCRCCEQCHAHRQLQLPLQAATYPWDDGTGNNAVAVEPRFWATQPPGNFYSPNPGGDEHLNGMNAACHGHNERTGRSSGWSWPRMPWQRNTPESGRRFRQTAASPDSQYGFSTATDGNMLIEDALSTSIAGNNGTAFSVVANALPYGVWGPPPPYSDPNSPARRGYYQYLNPNICLAANNVAAIERSQATVPHIMEQRMACQHQNITGMIERSDCNLNNSSVACLPPTTPSNRSQSKRPHNNTAMNKAKDYENAQSDSDGCGGVTQERGVNTLPTRKLKKRIEAGAKSIGPNNQSTQRPNVQQVFAETNNSVATEEIEENGGITTQGNRNDSIVNVGVENTGYQCSTDSNNAIASNTTEVVNGDPSESEVYFADVSSCCNMSVKMDNYYEDANQQQQHARQHQHQHHHHHHQHQHSNCSHSSNQSNISNNNNNNNNEDYLAQRFGRRENSIRSRLPFPQTRLGDDYEISNLNMPSTKNVTLEQQQQQMQKDISRQSMCSIESEAKTEFTDLSPSTPCNGALPPPPASFACTESMPMEQQQQQHHQATNFVASAYPYSSESQCLEAHRRSTKNIHELLVNSESHYEIINDRYQAQAQQGQQQQQQQQRPTNLVMSTKMQNKVKSRSREHLDNVGTASFGFQAEMDWSDGGGNGRTKRM